VQHVELNRGRLEARALLRFPVSAEQVGFPAAQQAARLTRFVERKSTKGQQLQTEWLICSRPLSAQAMYEADRRYWGIENGLHLRLDVSAGEDRSRVCHPQAALNLAMLRRAVVSLAVHWIQRCQDKRQATLQGFFDFMAAKNAKKAFSVVTALKTSWLPQS
jgi:predicted transposase YbfD/YdcC